jgi:hypothetical protein
VEDEMTAASALIAGLFMLAFSLVSFVENMIALVRFISIRSRGVVCKGLVKELVYDEDENLACGLLVEYGAPDGCTYQVTSSMANAFWRKYLNKQIDIIYDRRDPGVAYIVKELKLRFGVFFIVTFVWTMAALGLLFYGLYQLIFT